MDVPWSCTDYVEEVRKTAINLILLLPLLARGNFLVRRGDSRDRNVENQGIRKEISNLAEVVAGDVGYGAAPNDGVGSGRFFGCGDVLSAGRGE
jgi:hypothetical protein